VLYILGLRTNLLNLGLLLHKGFVMKMEDNCLSVFDQERKLVIKANLSKNRTFRVVMHVVNHQCFTLTQDKAEWLGHMRFGYLNFRDLTQLCKDSMVNGLPPMQIPDTMCKECV